MKKQLSEDLILLLSSLNLFLQFHLESDVVEGLEGLKLGQRTVIVNVGQLLSFPHLSLTLLLGFLLLG